MITDYLAVEFSNNPDTSHPYSIVISFPSGVTQTLTNLSFDAPSPLSTPDNEFMVSQGYMDRDDGMVQVQGNIGILAWGLKVQCPSSPLTGTISARIPAAGGTHLSVPVAIRSYNGGGLWVLPADQGTGSFSLSVANASAETQRQFLDQLKAGSATPRR